MLRVSVIAAVTIALAIAPMLLAFNVAPPSSKRSATETYLQEVPLRINSDAELQSMASSKGWPGNGNSISPYVIQGYEIDAKGYANAFYIANTTLYFVVRDSYFHGAYGSALYMSNLVNGVAENNTVALSVTGICPVYASVKISKNNVSGTTYGVYAISSSGCEYSQNTLTGNTVGLYFVAADYSIVHANSFSGNGYGVFLTSSVNCEFTWNNFTGEGITVYGNSVEYWATHAIDTSNSVNGLPVRYVRNTSGGVVPSGAGQVIVANCNGVSVMGQQISNTSVAIDVGFSSKTGVQNNKLSDCVDGIRFYSSTLNSATFNNLTGNSAGIDLWDSNYSYLYNNNFTTNGRGVYLDHCYVFNLQNDTIIGGDAAIYIMGSRNGTLINNRMETCGIMIEGDLVDYWNSHVIPESNTVNNLPVRYLKNVIGVPVPAGSGQIILANANQLVIQDQTIVNATVSVLMGFCGGNMVSRCTLNGGMYGVYASYSMAVAVSQSLCCYNSIAGIRFDHSEQCTAMIGSADYNGIAGLEIISSPRCTVNGMVFQHDGVMVQGSLLEDWNTHTMSTVSVNGRLLSYYADAVGGTAAADAGQLILGNCTGMKVNPVTIENATAPFQLGFCSGIQLTNVTARNNQIGVTLQGCADIYLIGCSMTYNLYGLWATSTDGIRALECMFGWNSAYGVYFDYACSGNRIWNGTFAYNNGAGNSWNPVHRQAFDVGSGNMWNDTARGNFWQDWQTPDGNGDGIVDIPYVLPGSGRDFFPLTVPTQPIPEFTALGLVLVTALLVSIAFTLRTRRPSR